MHNYNIVFIIIKIHRKCLLIFITILNFLTNPQDINEKTKC